ncbi:peptidoglycan editing factor PgeF [Exiguobacterium aurantiacum]|uniref:Purine nucleoside phosphorylase n=1 Tax=Exiguobacterium aurantiacum TaxID=33987 RepID=A0A377FW55_9BACL|nr:peptidoglycan editing factor PgeF [Exiguobacterium aurantiacum]STO08543.1 Laccase domain protein yfiH [Exiguobacterium aurantiacum]
MRLIHTWETETERYSAYVTTRTDWHNEGNVGLHVGDEQSAVVDNRNRFFTESGLNLADSVWADQVHGKRVALVDESDRGKGAFDYAEAIQATDGLVTRAENVPLALVFADCVPLFFCAKAHGVVGVAHAGWKGTVGNIVGAMADAFAELGVPEEDIDMFVGPAITSEHYEVDRRVLDAVKHVSEAAYAGAVMNEREDGHAELSLQHVNETLAAERNMDVTQSNLSTVTDRTYFSYRNGDASRRFAAVLVKEKKS